MDTQLDRPPADATHTAVPARACNCAHDRDRHLFCPGPKRILALDGGGVRGAITVAFLEQIEKVLTERLGKPAHLADWFDLIGGTSTGAVIAGALALGYTIKDITNFYLQLAPKIFKRSFWFWRVVRGKSKFDGKALRKEIEHIVGKRTLDTEDMSTGFCLFTKRLDTDSTWILANNPLDKYWETQEGNDGYIGNRYYPLANLVRASTAAPFYFEPEWIEIVKGGPRGLFVDGGVTPHNNPSVMLFLIARLKAFHIEWTATPENLTIVSIGTGTYRDRLNPQQLGMGWTAKVTYRALVSLINDIQSFALMQMQYLGECLTPWKIDSQVGTLEDDKPASGKMFRFLRYDVKLELDWIETEIGPEVEQEFGRKLTETDVIRMRSMDDPTIIKDIYRLARIAAQKQVKAEHWTGDLACWCDGSRPSAKMRTMPAPAPRALPPWFKTWLWIAERASFLRSWLVREQEPPEPPKPSNQ